MFLYSLCDILGGAVSGLGAQTITYPGDTIRRRMMTNGIHGNPRVYLNSWDCCNQIMMKEGIIGMFRGWSTNAIRCIPGAAIQFSAYEFLKRLLGC